MYVGDEDPRADDLYTTWKVRTKYSKEIGDYVESEIRHCIDYIFYSPSSLSPQTLLLPYKQDEVNKERFPSATYPSDHLSLMCDFSFLA